MKRKCSYLFSILFVLLFAAVGARGLTLTELEFDNAALQAKIAPKFPFTKQIFTKNTHMFVGTVTLTNPIVQLDPGSDRIPITMNFSFDPVSVAGVIKHKPFTGEFTASGKLRYDPTLGEFFFDESSLDDADVDGLIGLGDKWIIKYVNRKLPQWLNDKPVFKLDGDLKKEAIRQVLQQVLVRKNTGKLIIKLGVGDASPEPREN